MITKQTLESILVSFDFSSKMINTTEIITTINSIVSLPAGIILSNNTISGQTVTCIAASGLDKKTYKLTALITTDANQILELDSFIKIDDI